MSFFQSFSVSFVQRVCVWCVCGGGTTHTHTHTTHTHHTHSSKTETEKKTLVKAALECIFDTFNIQITTAHCPHTASLVHFGSGPDHLGQLSIQPVLSISPRTPFTRSHNGVLLVQQLSHFVVILAKRAFHLDSPRLLHTHTKTSNTNIIKPETKPVATRVSRNGGGWGVGCGGEGVGGGETISQMSHSSSSPQENHLPASQVPSVRISVFGCSP